MIFVTRKDEENSQKVVATFLKRSKKANTVARARKTKYHNKKDTSRMTKAKALRTVNWLKENEFKNIGKF